MRLGVNVPNFGPETDTQTLLGWAGFAEGDGFATLVVSDHVAPTPEATAVYPAPFYDPFVLLAWLVGHTTTGTLGTSVPVLPLRHPLSSTTWAPWRTPAPPRSSSTPTQTPHAHATSPPNSAT